MDKYTYLVMYYRESQGFETIFKKKIKIANSFLDITRLKQAKLITFGGGLVNEIMFS